MKYCHSDENLNHLTDSCSNHIKHQKTLEKSCVETNGLKSIMELLDHNILY